MRTWRIPVLAEKSHWAKLDEIGAMPTRNAMAKMERVMDKNAAYENKKGRVARPSLLFPS
jgi:hypothetical protein